ncbi:MAG TPA: protein kinase [Candidatus Dormibacteraeota bacterium]|nr:protein kinase [Candidatus Dormibacteraeota bacterium]
MPIGPGTTLGAYEVQEILGQGAMGTVYRAYHPGLARTAAVKVLSALTPDPDAVARFRREAQAIARMRHPNVLNVYDFGEHDGIPYMIVEYVAGGSLNDRMKSGERYPRPESIKLLDGIGAALDYAHGLDIIHRDVKPANVLLDQHGNPILADFGLAKLLQQSSLKTVSGVTTGTPAYMSPEQVMGAAVGPAADTYALTTMAYELLAGAIPFEGEGVLELLYAHVHREPPPASSRNPDLNPAVDAVLARGLAKDPAQRWESGATLVAALRQAFDETRPEPARLVEATMPVAAAPLPVPMPAAPGPKSTPLPWPPAGGRRGRAVPIALGAVVVLLLVAGVLLILRGAHPTGPRLAAIPGTVRRGGSVRVDATGFASGRAFVGIGNGGGSGAVLASGLATESGSWSTSVSIPATLPPGRYTLRACNAPEPGSGCATTAISVTR